jgi:hypothetical protein
MNRPQATRAGLAREDVLQITSALLALGALSALPWPGLEGGAPPLWLAWSLLEAAWLLPLLPALLAGAPPVARAGVRQAQIGVLGRAALWLALGVLAGLGASWQLAALPPRLLALVSAAFALPAALGWGPFGPLPGWPGSSADAGLPERTARLGRASYGVRCAALLLATLVLALPLPLPAPAALATIVGAAALLALAGARLRGQAPRLTLEDALRHTALRALPLGIAAIIYSAALAGAGG